MLTALLLCNTAAELNEGRIKEKEQPEKLLTMGSITQHHSIQRLEVHLWDSSLQGTAKGNAVRGAIL